MGPSWAKMASGSELDVIFGQMRTNFGHLRTKMEAKFDLEAMFNRLKAIFGRSWRRKRAMKAKTKFWIAWKYSGGGGL